MTTEPEVALRNAVRDYIRSVGRPESGIAANGVARLSCWTMDGLAEARQSASDILSHEISQCLQEINAQNSMAILPLELLADVFSHMGIYDRFSASEVCHQWRFAATQFAGAWTDLDGFGLLSPRLVVAMDRSRSLPIRLSFTLEVPDPTSSLESRNIAEASLRSLLVHVTHHLHHVQLLTVKLRFAHRTMPILMDALAVAAPMMKELTLDSGTSSADGGAEVTLRGDLFAGLAPMLTRITLRHVLLPAAPIPAFAAATFLHLKTRTERARVYQTAHLVLPKLTEYELDVPHAYYPDAVHPGIPPAQKLQVVRLLAPCTTPIMTLRPYARCPRISLVQVPSKLIARVWRDATPPTRMVVLSLDGRAFVGGANDAGICRLFRDVIDFAHSADLLSHAASHLRALVTDTVRWPDTDRSVLAFPQLAYLHIIVQPVGGTGWTRQHMPVWMRAPGLKTLRISVVDEETVHAQAAFRKQVTSFLVSLEPRAPVFLELDGLTLGSPGLPEGFVLRPPSLSIDHFLVNRLDQFAHWDDWLAHALAQLRDL